jgi:actin-related protein
LYPDEVGAIVIDVGTATTKVGFAGKDTPQAIFPTVCDSMLFRVLLFSQQ